MGKYEVPPGVIIRSSVEVQDVLLNAFERYDEHPTQYVRGVIQAGQWLVGVTPIIPILGLPVPVNYYGMTGEMSRANDIVRGRMDPPKGVHPDAALGVLATFGWALGLTDDFPAEDSAADYRQDVA